MRTSQKFSLFSNDEPAKCMPHWLQVPCNPSLIKVNNEAKDSFMTQLMKLKKLRMSGKVID